MKERRPEPPAITRCKCGNEIKSEWVKPMYIGGTLLSFSGKWRTSSICQACEDTLMAKEQEERETQSENLKFEQAGMGDRYLRELKFSLFKSDSQPRKNIGNKIRPIYHNARVDGIPRNMYLCGHAGTGKTLIAASFCRMALTKGKYVLFCPVPEMILRLREKMLSSRHLEEVDRITNHDVLCLDDLGAEKTTDWVNEAIYLLIDRWYRQKKQGLIITSNLELGNISERFGDRLASRIAGMCEIIDFRDCHDGRLT